MQANVKITLGQKLEDVGITRNAVAVERKIHPATISELCNGDSKSISFDTLERIVNALNTLDKDDNGKLYGIHDVMIIKYGE